MQRTMYSGRSAISPNAVADPNSGLQVEVSKLLPEARATPTMPYAARTQRGGAATRAHLTYCE
jgi:hypothetical protein